MCTYIWKTNSNLSGMVWSSVGPVAGWCYRLFRTGGLALQPPRQMSATESWLHRHRCCCDYYRMTSTNWTWTLDGWDLVTKDWSALRPTQSTTDDKSYRLCLVFLCIFNYTRCSVDHSNQKCWALFLRNRILSSVFFVLFYFICLLVALDEPNLFENNRDSALKSHYSLTHQLRTDEIMACSTSSFSCRNFLKEKAEKSRRCDGHRNQLRYFLWGVYTFWLHIYVCVCWTLVIPFPSTCLPILRLRAARRAQYARGNGSGWALLGALIYIISFFSRSWWSMCVLG